MTPAERKRHDGQEEKRHRKFLKEQDEREQQWRQRALQVEEAHRWDATLQFQPTIIKPPDKNKQLNSSTDGFVVWCSDGYGNDGWHSYNPPPDQHFETIWKTAKEANDRARYLFFWKNSYGIGPDEVHNDDGEPRQQEVMG